MTASQQHGARSQDSARLDRLFRPKSVAVVGASTNASFVSSILFSLITYGYAGRISAVNPRYDTVLDVPCYPSVLDVPGDLDLVIAGVDEEGDKAGVIANTARALLEVDRQIVRLQLQDRSRIAPATQRNAVDLRVAIVLHTQPRQLLSGA